METLDSPNREQIVAALEKAGATLPCPRCGNSSFTVIESSSIPTLTPPNTINLGRLIPTAVVACTRCGYLSLHAYGVLGLLMQEPKEENKE